MNLYEYVQSHPINLTDPEGLWHGDIHIKLTDGAYNQVKSSLKPCDKCDGYMQKTLENSNTGQDKGKAANANERHYCTPVAEKKHGHGSHESKDYDKEYGKYLTNELNDFNKYLKNGDKGCEDALMSLGRLSHSWQDFYGHAQKKDGSFIAWTGKPPVTGDPYNRGDLVPPKYPDLKGHFYWEPINPSSAEGVARYNAASNFMAVQYKSYLTQWWGNCSSWCNQKK